MLFWYRVRKIEDTEDSHLATTLEILPVTVDQEPSKEKPAVDEKMTSTVAKPLPTDEGQPKPSADKADKGAPAVTTEEEAPFPYDEGLGILLLLLALAVFVCLKRKKRKK